MKRNETIQTISILILAISMLFMSLHIEIKHKQTVKPKQTIKTYNTYYDRHIYTIEVSDNSAVIINVR